MITDSTEISTPINCLVCGHYHPHRFNIGGGHMLCYPCHDVARPYWWELGLAQYLSTGTLREMLAMLWYELEQLPVSPV